MYCLEGNCEIKGFVIVCVIYEIRASLSGFGFIIFIVILCGGFYYYVYLMEEEIKVQLELI